MKYLLFVVVFLARLASADIIASGIFSNGTIGPTNNIPSGGGAPGDGYESSLYAYYKCEESSSPAVDSAHGRNVPQRAGASCTIGSAHTTGFIGSGFKIACFDFLDRPDDGSGNFAFSGSFTVRLWINSTETVNNNFNNMVGQTSWNLNQGDGSNAGKIDWTISGNSATHDQVSAQTINDGSWHLVICWWDNGTGTMGVQIDNNTPATTTTGDTIFAPSPPNSLFFGGPISAYAGIVIIDEVAIWKDYVLTSGDRLFDWNSGAGQTYPLP